MEVDIFEDIASNNPNRVESESVEVGFQKLRIINQILSNKSDNGVCSYEQLVSQRENIVRKYGLKMYEQLLVDIIWPSKTQVSFEDFKEFPDLRNNFRGYFSAVGNFLLDYSYRKRGFYLRFAENNDDLVRQLIHIYDRSDLIFYTLNDVEMELLYMAYELMLDDDEVTKNYDLFI